MWKKMESITTEARTDGVSLKLMDSTTNRPTPGHAKMDSVTTEPPSRPPKLRPIMVTMGISAFFNIWRRMTVDSFRPLDLAVSI